MDSLADLDPSAALLSPSKAREHENIRRDWKLVYGWLEKKHFRKLPPFELHEQTLQAFLELAAFNDARDEQRATVDRIEKAALLAHSNRIDNEIYKTLVEYSELPDLVARISQLMVKLDRVDHQSKSMAAAVIDLTTHKFAAEEELRHSQAQFSAVKLERGRLSRLIDDLESKRLEDIANGIEDPAKLAPQVKQMRAKISEYDDRLSSSQPLRSPLKAKLGEVLEQMQLERAQREQAKELRDRVEAMKGLPTASKAARLQVDKAKAELKRLVMKREELFQDLVSGD